MGFGALAYDPMTGLAIAPEEPSADAPVVVKPQSAFSKAINRLVGTQFGEPRMQLWPEKLVRSAVTLPGDVASGEQALLPPGLRREDYTDFAPAARGAAEGIFGNTLFTPQPWQPNDPAYERAQDTAGLAGGGMMFGRLGAEATLGSGPVMRRHSMIENADHLRELANQRRARGEATGKSAPGWDFKWPEAPKGSWEDTVARTKAQWETDKSRALAGFEDVVPPKNQSPYLSADDHAFLASGQFLSDSATPGAPIAALEHAPKFYSGLERAVEAIPQPRMTGDQWLGTLNNRGVKPEEMDWTGLRGYLAERGNQPVTKAQVAEHLGANKLELGEIVKGEPKKFSAEEIKAEARAGAEAASEDWNLLGPNGRQRFMDEARRQLEGGAESTKFQDYQLLGGENYREKLLTLPPRADPRPDAAALRAAGADDMTLNRIHGERPDLYRSSHWDEPNVLVHRRTNERDVNGQRSLHIEEIQSDWHQQGRQKGYADSGKGWTAEKTEFAPGIRGFQVRDGRGNPIAAMSASSADEAISAARQTHARQSSVPDAPFKKNWHELALKDAIREAAEKGIDRISWTPGEAQAARYDLSHHIDGLMYQREGDKFYLDWKKKGDGTFTPVKDEAISPAELANYVGKDVADKIIKGEGEHYPLDDGHSGKVLSGLDLKVGGEGMRGFYDKMIPDALNKIGKPHGVKVQHGETVTKNPNLKIEPSNKIEGYHFEVKGNYDSPQFFQSKPEAEAYINGVTKKEGVHYMDIPQSLKDQALKKGFSLFEDAATTGAPLAAAEAAARAESPAGAYHALIDQPAGVPSAAAYHALLDQPPGGAYTAPHGPEAAPARETAPAPRGNGPGGAGGRDARLLEAQAAAARRAGAHQPLEGLPTKAMKIGDEYFVPGPIGKVRDVAAEYMANRETPSYHKPPDKYHPLDEEHSAAIARAFDEMPHAPNDPAVKASYDALIKETQAQYEAIKKTGLKIEPIALDMPDPYAANPRLAAKDVADNNHLWYFPTDSGFGSNPAAGIDMAKHPMMRPTGEKLGDRELLANDIFRIVHDYFGHLKEGYGFRAAGEDNAWRSHAAMYSDLARPAMTTETRGQNSWVNYGPHGEANRKAAAADTKYADQKVGLMPEWTMRDRGSPEPIIAYHGTPYSFDKFDPAHIGAGEGNQAYGHGLYFAGHSPVSEFYRHQLSARRDPVLKKYGLDAEDGANVGMRLASTNGDAAPVIADLEGEIANLRKDGDTSKGTQNMIVRRRAMVNYLKDAERNPGHLYEVAIDHPLEKFLDWDKPLKEQRGPVTEAFDPQWSDRVIGPEAKGKDLYEWLIAGKAAGLESQRRGPRAARDLRENGIAGIRYLDQGSRGVPGKGTHNYVTFDAPRLLRRYAAPGLIGAGGFGSLAPSEER